MIETHRDGFPRFSALSVRRGDAGHRKACATTSESLGKPPFRSSMRPVGGRRKTLTMQWHRQRLPSYGSNEFGVVSIAPPALVRNIPGVVGKVVPGMKAEVVDDRGNPLPSGRVGKLRLKSAGTIDGNLDDPVETARVFRDGWFYSDDLAEFTPNGELIHHGRVDDLMILDGINIYPAEIEDALLQHEKVAEAAAFPIPSKTHGDIPAAAVVVRSPVSVEELLSYCRSLLGRHSPSGLKIVHKVESGADAVTVGYGGCSVAFAPGLSPSPLVPFPDPRSSNRTCGFPASGFRTRSCLRARKGHGLPRETQEAVICAQPLFGVSHESPRPRLVLSTEPLA